MGVAIFIILCAHRLVYRLCPPDPIPVTMGVYRALGVTVNILFCGSGSKFDCFPG